MEDQPIFANRLGVALGVLVIIFAFVGWWRATTAIPNNTCGTVLAKCY